VSGIPATVSGCELGTDVETLAPQWLRAALRDRAAAIVGRYEAPSES
jgi:hypothetical protein